MLRLPLDRLVFGTPNFNVLLLVRIDVLYVSSQLLLSYSLSALLVGCSHMCLMMQFWKNIKRWVMDDVTTSGAANESNWNHLRKNKPTDAELLRTFYVGLLAIALNGLSGCFTANMENNQSTAIENPSDVQLKDESTKPGSDAAAAYQSMGSNNPDASMAAVAPYISVQNPANRNSGEIAGYQSTQDSENGALQNGVSSMTLDPQDQQYMDGVYFVEVERLWNMVRANCLDFNSWTSLIDETERVVVAF